MSLLGIEKDPETAKNVAAGLKNLRMGDVLEIPLEDRLERKIIKDEKREEKQVKMANCPECDANIGIPDDAVEGEIVTCPECGASFELAKASEGFELKQLKQSERIGDSDQQDFNPLRYNPS